MQPNRTKSGKSIVNSKQRVADNCNQSQYDPFYFRYKLEMNAYNKKLVSCDMQSDFEIDANWYCKVTIEMVPGMEREPVVWSGLRESASMLCLIDINEQIAS